MEEIPDNMSYCDECEEKMFRCEECDEDFDCEEITHDLDDFRMCSYCYEHQKKVELEEECFQKIKKIMDDKKYEDIDWDMMFEALK